MAAQFKKQGAAECNARRTDGELPNKNCVFHDVTQGDMIIRDLVESCFGAAGSSIIGHCHRTPKLSLRTKQPWATIWQRGWGVGGRDEPFRCLAKESIS